MYCNYNSKLAERFGVNSALVADYFRDKLTTSSFKRDNRTWLKFSARKMSAIYPHMKRKAAAGALKRLVDNGILIRRAFDKSRFDNTYYYTFTDYGEQLVQPDNYDD